jgi:hypothetical protein
MRTIWIAALGLIAVLGACAPQAPKADKAAESASTCRDEGPRFPGTDICLINVSKYLAPERVTVTDLSPRAEKDGCSWTFNQTMMGDGTEALLYRAMSCKGVTTALEFAGGARSAALTIKDSAFGFTPGQEVVRIFTSDPADPQNNIQSLIDGLPAAEKAKCEVQPAPAQFPAGALVIGYKPAHAAKLPKDEPNAVCGDFGLDEGSQRYWLVRDGYAFFFDLGQEELDWDPASLTVIRKGADGAWATVQ